MIRSTPTIDAGTIIWLTSAPPPGAAARPALALASTWMDFAHATHAELRGLVDDDARERVRWRARMMLTLPPEGADAPPALSIAIRRRGGEPDLSWLTTDPAFVADAMTQAVAWLSSGGLLGDDEAKMREKPMRVLGGTRGYNQCRSDHSPRVTLSLDRAIADAFHRMSAHQKLMSLSILSTTPAGSRRRAP